MTEYGVICGRFQIFHNDHLEYALAAKAKCEHLVVGITNPDPSHFTKDPADPARHLEMENPLSYFERQQLIHRALGDEGIGVDECSTVPFPIDRPELISAYAPSRALFFLTIYDRWGQEKRKRLEALGFATEVLWERPEVEKKLHGKQLRRLIAAGEPWREFVPEGVATLVEAWRLDERIRSLID